MARLTRSQRYCSWPTRAGRRAPLHDLVARSHVVAMGCGAAVGASAASGHRRRARMNLSGSSGARLRYVYSRLLQPAPVPSKSGRQQSGHAD